MTLPTKDQKILRLAIAAESSGNHSETFIQMQMTRLPCVLRIHDKNRETLPGGSVPPWPDPVVIARRISRVLGSATTENHPTARPSLQNQTWQRFVTRQIRRQRVNLALLNFGPIAVRTAPACIDAGIPFVVHFHGYDAHMESIMEKFRDSYAWLGRQAAAIIVVSGPMRDSLIRAGMPPEKIHLLRYGADSSQFIAKDFFPESPVFFGVGRFVDKKAPHLTVLAFKKVHDRHPGARLILGGSGELLESTRNLADYLGLSEAVLTPGVLKHDEVASYMRQATAFVQHSVMPVLGPSAGDCEGTPVAILEAMVTGLPVISTRHTGIAEVVEHGKSGLLVDERDVDGMARAMESLAASPELARAMGSAARDRAGSLYTSEHYISSLATILESSLQDSRG